jgi:hypothetical protein
MSPRHLRQDMFEWTLVSTDLPNMLLFCLKFTWRPSFTNSNYIASNKRMISEKDELERIWKEAVVA